MDAPIGVFDSGIGGLTVARRIVDRLPHESLLYLGDTARVPYGNKSPETVRRYSLNIARRLRAEGAKALVIACNTASAYALEALEDAMDIPVIGVVEPVAAVAAQRTQTGMVAVLGTRGTVSSGAYVRALHRHAPDLEILGQACPLFVPLAEEGWTDGEVVELVARRYLEVLRGTQVDTLILGCTHYPLLAPVIGRVAAEVTGREVAVLDSAGATTEALAQVLSAAGLFEPAGTQVMHRFWMTDLASSFSDGWSRFFGEQLQTVEHVDL